MAIEERVGEERFSVLKFEFTLGAFVQPSFGGEGGHAGGGREAAA